MARFHWLLLSCLSMFLFCSPAEAGKLLFWRFESDQNRLVFTTDAGVQPRAQLIFNPTRLVIDLPGTVLGKPTDKQAFGGTIRSVRVGQFDPQTTRIVVELEPGYTIDPQQVEFRGISPTQWTVNLPSPQAADTLPPPASEPDTPTLEESSTPPSPIAIESESSSEAVQVTRSGLLIELDGSSENEIEVSRSRDRRSIDVELPGTTLPAHLESQTLAVNSYGVSEIEFEQTSNSPPVAHLTLNVSEASPDWQATFSRLGGLVLFPQGGTSAIASSPTTTTVSSRSLSRREATVVAAELADDDTRLLIRGDGGRLNATGDWNSVTGVYEITIPNAKLDKSFEGPDLQTTSPIAKLRVRQENDETVVFLVEPALGVQVNGVDQQGDDLDVQLRLPRAAAATPATVFVPPPDNSTPPPTVSPPPQAAPPPVSPAVPQGQIMVTIDPGHGGKDPGTIGINGVQEKNIVLPISLQVKQYLEQQGVRVQMTRDSDYFVSLEGRSQMANRADADLFVSIHANAINLSRPDVNGLEVYYFQSGQRLAQTIHRSILQSVSIRDRRVRQARFYVLRKSSMPAVLVETGFLTGQEDAANLTQESYRRQMAEAIARGILDYIRQNSL